MSVFLVNADREVVLAQDGAEASGLSRPGADAHQALAEFWPRATHEIKNMPMDVRQQALPLARIKKIMKLDEDVKMISAEAPVLFSKAAELFIQELTLRAWVHTEDNKRRTLQRNDIAMAVSKYDQFDFLIDIVPREEPRPAQRSSHVLDQVQYYVQAVQDEAGEGREAGGGGEQSPIHIIQDVKQPVQGLQVVQQVIGANGEIQHAPVELSERQLELLRVQLESGNVTPGAPIILTQPQPQMTPQLVQVRQSSPLYIQTVNQHQSHPS